MSFMLGAEPSDWARRWPHGSGILAGGWTLQQSLHERRAGARRSPRSEAAGCACRACGRPSPGVAPGSAPARRGGAAGGLLLLAAVGDQAGAPVQLQRRRGDAFRAARGRRSSATTSTRTTSSTRRRTRTCCTSCSSCGSGARTRSHRAYTSDPTAVFVVARVVAAVLGTVRGVAHVPGRRAAVRPPGGPARGRDHGVRVPAGLLQPPGAQRRPHAGSGGAVAVRVGGRAAPRPHARLRDRRHRNRARAAHEVHGRDHARVPARGGGVRSGRRGSRDGARRVAAGWRCCSRSARSCSPTRTRRSIHRRSSSGVSQQASPGGGTEPVKLGTTAGSGIDYYLWTFTWGLGWGPALAAVGGAVLLLVRRRIATALVLLPAPIAFIIFMGDQQRFFGRWLMPIFPIVAVLGGVRRDRAGTGSVAAARRSARPAGGAGVARGRDHRRAAARAEHRRRHPQRRRPVPTRHAQPRAGVDGRPHPGRERRS